MRWWVLFAACAVLLGGCSEKSSNDGQTSTVGSIELWAGPVTGHLTAEGCSAEPKLTGDISLSVDNGRVSGRSTEDVGSYACGDILQDPPAHTYEITGTKTKDAFELTVGGKPLRMNITDDRHASASVETSGAEGYKGTVTYTVDCSNCR